MLLTRCWVLEVNKCIVNVLVFYKRNYNIPRVRLRAVKTLILCQYALEEDVLDSNSFLKRDFLTKQLSTQKSQETDCFANMF